MTREEIVRALRCFASEDYCPFDECNEKCQYWMEIDKYDIDNPNAEISDVHQLCYAAADLLEQDVPPTDMVPKDFHDRCMEMEIERRISLEGMHKKAVDEICELKDRVQNLTLDRQEGLDTDSQLYDWLDKRHPGLPGYAPNISNN